MHKGISFRLVKRNQYGWYLVFEILQHKLGMFQIELSVFIAKAVYLDAILMIYY